MSAETGSLHTAPTQTRPHLHYPEKQTHSNFQCGMDIDSSLTLALTALTLALTALTLALTALTLALP